MYPTAVQNYMAKYTVYFDPCELIKVSGENSDVTILPLTRRMQKRYKLHDVDLPYEEANAAFVNGNFAGVASYDSERKELMAIWVDPKYRRRGIGTTLLRSFSTQPSLLMMEPDNETALKFYSRMGFQDSGRRPYGKFRLEREER
jgi:ribosomal protein S18 acetylase RimI-like enzyme